MKTRFAIAALILLATGAAQATTYIRQSGGAGTITPGGVLNPTWESGVFLEAVPLTLNAGDSLELHWNNFGPNPFLHMQDNSFLGANESVHINVTGQGGAGIGQVGIMVDWALTFTVNGVPGSIGGGLSRNPVTGVGTTGLGGNLVVDEVQDYIAIQTGRDHNFNDIHLKLTPRAPWIVNAVRFGVDAGVVEFVATPVPEPATATVLAVGLLALTCVARRRAGPRASTLGADGAVADQRAS